MTTVDFQKAYRRAFVSVWKGAAAEFSSRRFGDPSGHGKPIRLHPNTPPVRDAEHQAKHRKRKIVNASRRRKPPVMKMPRLTVSIDGLERIEKISEMVEKTQVLEALGPDDRLILSTGDRRITAEQMQQMRDSAVDSGLVADKRHVVILTDGIEIEAVFRAPQQIEIGSLFRWRRSGARDHGRRQWRESPSSWRNDLLR